MSNDYLNINKIKDYLPPGQSDIKIGSDNPQSKDVLFTPGAFDPSSTGKWGNQLNDGTFKEIQVSFNEIKAYMDDTKPIIDQLVEYSNDIDLFRKNTQLKGFGIRQNSSRLNTIADGYLYVHGYDSIGLPKEQDGWFYLQSDFEQGSPNNGKLVEARNSIKAGTLGLIGSDFNNDLLIVAAKQKPETKEWYPILLALKEEKINETQTQFTTNEWDRNTERLSKVKTVNTDVKYPNHDVKQYQIRYATQCNDGTSVIPVNTIFDYEQITNRTINNTESKWDSVNELVLETANASYQTTKEKKYDYVILGFANADYNSGVTKIYNLLTLVQPISFDEFYEDVKIKRSGLQQKIKQFTECYKLFKKIQLEIEERKLDVNTLKADVEQNIREFLLKKKGSELFLEYFNNTHTTPYDVLTKDAAYPSDLSTTKRIISAELLAEKIKYTWLHGTDSTKVLKLGRAGNLINGESNLKTGLTIDGNLRIIESTIIEKQLTVNGSTELNGTVQINNNASIPAHKLTVKDLQSTNVSTLNTVNISGTTTATGVVNVGTTANATNVKGTLNIDGVTNATGLITANNGITIVDGKQLNGDIANLKTVTISRALTNNGTTTLNGVVEINNITNIATPTTLTTIRGNAKLNQTLTVDGTSQFNNNVTINTGKQLTVPTINSTTISNSGKITTVTHQTTGTTDLNVLNVTGTTTATGIVNTGSPTTATNVKGQLVITGTTTANSLITANQGITIPTSKKLTTDLADINTLVVKVAQTNNGTTTLNGVTTINNDLVMNEGFTFTNESPSVLNGEVDVNNNVRLGTTTTTVTNRGDVVNDKTITTIGTAQFNNDVTVATGKKLTTDLTDINTLNVKTSGTINTLTVNGVTTHNNHVNVPAHKVTTKDLQSTGITTANTMNISGTTTATGVVNLGAFANATNVKGALNVTGVSTFADLINANNGLNVPVGKKLITDLLDVNTLVVKTSQTNNGTFLNNGVSTFNNTVTINTGKVLNSNGTTNLSTTNITGVVTATNVINLGSTSNATNIKGQLNVAGNESITGTSSVTGAVTHNSTLLQKGKLTVQGGTETNTLNVTGNTTLNTATINNLTINTTTLQKGKLTAQAGIDVTGEVNVSTNVKAHTIYQNGKSLDEIYLQKYQGSTGVTALNVPRETEFLVQRNVTDQITAHRCDFYEDMLYDSATGKFEHQGNVKFYPELNALSFKEIDNFVEFSHYNASINNKHIFVAFDVREIPTIEKDIFEIELSDSKKIKFKVNQELDLVTYLDDVKLNQSSIFKDIDILRECFGFIIKNEKCYLIHDGIKVAEFNITSIKNQTFKKITIGSRNNSLFFDLYTLMIGTFDNSQWSNLEIDTYHINNQYSQEVYQCFGNFKYNENLDKVNFSFESSSLPYASLLQKGIVQLTNVIEDREDIAVTPRALIDFNVQSIYESKFNDNLVFNINKGITDTVNELTPSGYNDLNLSNCLINGDFSNTSINGNFTKNGLKLNSTTKINYSNPAFSNWVFILEWNKKQLFNKTGNFKLCKLIDFGTIPVDIKTLENSFRNTLVVHSNGNCFFNGSKIQNISLSNITLANLELNSTQELIINKLCILNNITYEDRELRYISKYGFETKTNFETAPIVNSLCNWSQLRQIINHTEIQIQGLKSKIKTKTLSENLNKLSFNDITEEIIEKPYFYIDGELFMESLFTWNETTKEFALNGIQFTHPKEITCLYKYRIKTNLI